MDRTNFQDTMQFRMDKDESNVVHDIIMRVYKALKQKGYDPINQIVGYIISGDPTYITSHDNARYLLRRLERDEILEELVSFYILSNEKDMDDEAAEEK